MTQAMHTPADDAGLSPEEIAAMARVLARRYRGEAAGVALHFAAEHRAVGDEARAGAWTRVARLLRPS